jgi:hypothetical protein
MMADIMLAVISMLDSYGLQVTNGQNTGMLCISGFSMFGLNEWIMADLLAVGWNVGENPISFFSRG